MLRLLQVLFFIFIALNTSFGQEQVTTEDGKKVFLFDDGTWKYVKTATITNSVADLKIDSLKVITTDLEELFYVTSSKLDNYFLEPRNNIRCKVSCSNNYGAIKLGFMWEVRVTEVKKYFGLYGSGKKMIFTMLDGQKIELIMGDENKSQSWPGGNYSVISNNTQELSLEQISALMAQPISKLEVGWWKKDSEVYDFSLSDYFMETLPTILY